MQKSLKENLKRDNPVRTAIDILNNPRPEGLKIRNNFAQLVVVWLEAERAYEVYIKAYNNEADRFLKNGGKWEDLTPPKKPRLKLPTGCPTETEIGKKCRVFLPEIGNRHGPMIMYIGSVPQTEWDEALFYFVPLVMRSDPHHLGGPCPRCGRFFLKTRRTRLYCSHNCASVHTAGLATKRNREAEHQRKLQLAVQETEEWEKSGRRRPWQAFVIAKAPELSIRWLTRAVNKGELTPPPSAPSTRVASSQQVRIPTRLARK